MRVKSSSRSACQEAWRCRCVREESRDCVLGVSGWAELERGGSTIVVTGCVNLKLE